mmetsp:Transcript_93575/g.260547  ORF Transcript_93575/g.260547 Transcript_93575/m.260547 type:complete len:226 (+) Transcript_93575:1258-1935(+)
MYWSILSKFTWTMIGANSRIQANVSQRWSSGKPSVCTRVCSVGRASWWFFLARRRIVATAPFWHFSNLVASTNSDSGTTILQYACASRSMPACCSAAEMASVSAEPMAAPPIRSAMRRCRSSNSREVPPTLPTYVSNSLKVMVPLPSASIASMILSTSGSSAGNPKYLFMFFMSDRLRALRPLLSKSLKARSSASRSAASSFSKRSRMSTGSSSPVAMAIRARFT